MASFGIVGAGWRASAYLAVAQASSGELEVTGVVARSLKTAERLRAAGTPTFADVSELLDHGPLDFVVVCVPTEVALPIVQQITDRAVPVLWETPPARDLEGLRAMWARLRDTAGLVQVAEQHTRLPLIAAQLAAIRAGAIGEPVWAHVDSTHLYHAASILRSVLGVGVGPATVQAHVFEESLLDPVTREGWSSEPPVHARQHTVATLAFDSGKGALYEFTDNQWLNPLLPQVLRVRGARGHLDGSAVVHLLQHDVVGTSPFTVERSGVGIDYFGADLTAIHLEGRVLYRNPFDGWRLSDDEIATAVLLRDMSQWSRHSGPPPYPLSEASHDAHLGFAIVEAGRSGVATEVTEQPWW